MKVLMNWAMILFVAFGSGCDPKAIDTGDGEVNAAELSLYPNMAGRGVALDVLLQSTRSQFVFGETSLDLGDGVTILNITVSDGYNATASIIVEPDAESGARDATITIQERTETLFEAFRVIDESIFVDPGIGKMGEIVDVAIVGTGTTWEEGYTWAGFGDGIDVVDFTVLSEKLAAATISIRSDAQPGPRNVSVESGSHVVTKYDGFMVDRAVITAFFDPKKAYQGDLVDFTITGLDTNWTDGQMLVQFWDDGGNTNDIQIQQLTVIDSENMYGRMRLSNAATIGMRDVYISRLDIDESVLVPDALEILDAPPSLDNVAIGLAFDVSRSVDNNSCDVAESVRALAYFIIPLDPPCGSAPPPGDGPKPFDANGVWPVPPEAEPVDCPNPETVSAGDFVWFESDENVVTLHKDVISSTGQIIYSGQDLTLDDYRFGQIYDLHTQGDPEGIPEVVLEEVQPTCPCDFELVEPLLCNDYTQPAAEQMPLSWTPGGCTYPNAAMGSQVSGTLSASGGGGFAGVVPWDDGAHQFTPTELGQLDTGPVSFGMSCGIQGPYFGFPFSTIQTNQSGSSVSVGGQMTLE